MGDVHQRLAFLIGSKLPRPLKILYYIVLFGTLIYLLYRLLEWAFKTIRVIGEFIFKPQNYWAVVLCLFVLLIGSFLLAQFALGLDPIGHMIDWFKSILEQLRKW